MTRPWIHRTAPTYFIHQYDKQNSLLNSSSFPPEFYQHTNFPSSYKSSLFPFLMLIRHNQDSEIQQLVTVKCDDHLLLFKESAMPTQLPHTSPSLPVWFNYLIQSTVEDTHYNFIDSSFVEIIWRTNGDCKPSAGHLKAR